jgi:hypothetical protein
MRRAVFEALRHGASGFLSKDAKPADLLAAIRLVQEGQALPVRRRRDHRAGVSRAPGRAAGAHQVSADTVVEVRGLAKAYGRVRAVDGVDLTVRRGEVYGFLGPNGAGKTTTLRVLLGLVAPSAGSVRVLGRRPGAPWALARSAHSSKAPLSTPTCQGAKTCAWSPATPARRPRASPPRWRPWTWPPGLVTASAPTRWG